MTKLDIVTLLRTADGFDLVSETMNEGADEIERLREALAAMTELFKATEAVAQFGLSESRKLHEALAVIYRAHEKAMDEGETWFVTDDTTVGGYICSVLGAPPEEGK